jgi:glycosyl transferase family 87
MGRPGKVARAYIAANVGLVIGYLAILLRDLATPDIFTATDFTVFRGAWKLVLHGHASLLYDEAAQRATQRVLMGGGYFEGGLMAFLNPPQFALAGVPLEWLAERAGGQAAYAASIVCNLALLALFVRMLLAEWGPAPRQQRTMLVAAVLAFYPVFVTIKNGQLSLLLALALLGAYRATNAGRPWQAGAWLCALTVKPQLLPVAALYFVARRSWQTLAAAAVCGGALFAVTSLALGPAVWIEYARHVHSLERFWGTGKPDYMLNLRGELTRVFGLARASSIDPAAYAVWLVSLVAAIATVARRRLDRTADTRPEWALVLAVGLFANPHLFIHDAVLWMVPLLLYAASLRDSGQEWRRFAAFALAWPLVFLVAGRLDVRSGALTVFDLHTWTFVAAIVMMARHLPATDRRERTNSTAGLQAVALYRSWTS